MGADVKSSALYGGNYGTHLFSRWISMEVQHNYEQFYDFLVKAI